MPTGPQGQERPADSSQLAAAIVRLATGEATEEDYQKSPFWLYDVDHEPATDEAPSNSSLAPPGGDGDACDGPRDGCGGQHSS